MWTFLGLTLVAGVLWYWLRRIWRSLQAMGAVHEATVNRAAKLRGDDPVTNDIDARRIF